MNGFPHREFALYRRTPHGRAFACGTRSSRHLDPEKCDPESTPVCSQGRLIRPKPPTVARTAEGFPLAPTREVYDLQRQVQIGRTVDEEARSVPCIVAPQLRRSSFQDHGFHGRFPAQAHLRDCGKMTTRPADQTKPMENFSVLHPPCRRPDDGLSPQPPPLWGHARRAPRCCGHGTIVATAISDSVKAP